MQFLKNVLDSLELLSESQRLGVVDCIDSSGFADEVCNGELVLFLLFDQFFDVSVEVKHALLAGREGRFEHGEHFFDYGDVVGDNSYEVEVVLVRHVLFLRNAQVQEVRGVEQRHHTARYLTPTTCDSS